MSLLDDATARWQAAALIADDATTRALGNPDPEVSRRANELQGVAAAAKRAADAIRTAYGMLPASLSLFARWRAALQLSSAAPGDAVLRAVAGEAQGIYEMNSGPQERLNDALAALAQGRAAQAALVRSGATPEILTRAAADVQELQRYVDIVQAENVRANVRAAEIAARRRAGGGVRVPAGTGNPTGRDDVVARTVGGSMRDLLLFTSPLWGYALYRAFR